MKFNNTLLNLVQHDLDNNLIPMLLGEPGIGKSSWVKALGVHMHTKVFVLAVNQLADKADLTGSDHLKRWLRHLRAGLLPTQHHLTGHPLRRGKSTGNADPVHG